MYLIPLVRTSRSVAACTILPDNPLLAIFISEMISYTLPFINNSPINSMNDMVLFLFYYITDNESSIDIINRFKNKYILNYKLESISILTYLIIYFYIFNETS
tara:strand:- start:11472 stop:11780 length:309 start_codon:yes stop_codon:yes gene_type:complete